MFQSLADIAGTFLLLILIAPFMIGAWRAPLAAPTILSLAGFVVVIFAAAGLIIKLTIGWPITHELQFINAWGIPFLLMVPLLYAFSVGAATRLVSLVFCKKGSECERSVFKLGLAVMIGVPVWYIYL